MYKPILERVQRNVFINNKAIAFFFFYLKPLSSRAATRQKCT